MTIAVVSLKTPEIECYAMYTTEINRRYCQKHGVDYFCYDESLDKTKTPHWSKLLALKNHVMDYDWLLWVDADAAFANHSLGIQAAITDDDAMILMSKGRLYGWNSGVFLLHGGQESMDWLELVYGLHSVTNGRFYEQDAIVYSFGLTQYKDRVIEVPKNNINTGIKEYREDTFIVHAHGIDDKTRTRFFGNLCKRILG